MYPIYCFCPTTLIWIQKPTISNNEIYLPKFEIKISPPSSSSILVNHHETNQYPILQNIGSNFKWTSEWPRITKAEREWLYLALLSMPPSPHPHNPPKRRNKEIKQWTLFPTTKKKKSSDDLHVARKSFYSYFRYMVSSIRHLNPKSQIASS